jgi:hypothetical protein
VRFVSVLSLLSFMLSQQALEGVISFNPLHGQKQFFGSPPCPRHVSHLTAKGQIQFINVENIDDFHIRSQFVNLAPPIGCVLLAHVG